MKLPDWCNIYEFLSDSNEWHAFVDGFCFAMCPLFLLMREIRRELAMAIANELHYFAFGGFLGVLLWLLIVKII